MWHRCAQKLFHALFFFSITDVLCYLLLCFIIDVAAWTLRVVEAMEVDGILLEDDLIGHLNTKYILLNYPLVKLVKLSVLALSLYLTL